MPENTDILFNVGAEIIDIAENFMNREKLSLFINGFELFKQYSEYSVF
jgi:hypothetical protein